MPQRLKHIIWHAMNTNNSALCEYNDRVGVFKADIAPFAAMKEYDTYSFERLHEFITEPRSLAIVSPTDPDIPDIWRIKAKDDLYQMICHKPIWPSSVPINDIKPLHEEYISQMIALTTLTKPGPFLQKTNLFGLYYGIFDEDKLVSMAGQRFSFDRFIEISAVCTHPDHIGNGYGQSLMVHMMQFILSQGSTPFLHVRQSNETAIRLYKKLGFEINHALKLNIIGKRDLVN